MLQIYICNSNIKDADSYVLVTELMLKLSMKWIATLQNRGTIHIIVEYGISLQNLDG